VAADAACLPFDDGVFDIVISNETFEHIQRPLPALREVARVTRPRGWVFISFPPYYAPWGAHLNNWIRLPWVQVVFSEQTMINVAVKLDEKSQVSRRLAPETRLDLRGCQTLPHINKMTLRRFEALLARTSLQLVRRSFFGPGWRSRPAWHPLTQVLTRLPMVREMFTSHAVYVLQK
jgi:SAM-dependent methyltransferase